jgi:hypothetical protein
MKDEMESARRPVNWLLGSRGSLPKRVIRRIVLEAMNPWCGHSFMAIARRGGA